METCGHIVYFCLRKGLQSNKEIHGYFFLQKLPLTMGLMAGWYWLCATRQGSLSQAAEHLTNPVQPPNI